MVGLTSWLGGKLPSVGLCILRLLHAAPALRFVSLIDLQLPSQVLHFVEQEKSSDFFLPLTYEMLYEIRVT